jgi:O-antigen/teichoic acid export membrane protein
MKLLDFKELGVITIILTIIGFLGMFQIGFLNGGYRILSVNKRTNISKEVNNIIYTYFLILFIIITITVLILKYYYISLEISYLFIMFAIFFGLITLINNWIRNILSAYMNFKELNILEITSVSISLFILFTVPTLGLKGAILTILSQPAFFFIFALVKYNYVRPSKLFFNLKKIKWILTFGFIPFLSGIFLQINNQIEKWSIVYFLNTESLGKFYLPAIYFTLFMLIPLSVSKLFFPPAMRKYVNNDYKQYKKIIRYYFYFQLIYIISTFVITFFFLKPVVAYVFPEHLIAVKFVWKIFPGLVAMLILHPLSLVFYASVKLKPMLWAYLTSSIIMFLLIITGNKIFGFSLSLIAYIKSIIAIYITLFLYSFYFIKKNYFWEINKHIA